MAYIVIAMAYVMAYIVLYSAGRYRDGRYGLYRDGLSVVMACTVMTYIVMDYKVMAYIVMARIAMAYMVMACMIICRFCLPPRFTSSSVPAVSRSLQQRNMSNFCFPNVVRRCARACVPARERLHMRRCIPRQAEGGMEARSQLPCPVASHDLMVESDAWMRTVG